MAKPALFAGEIEAIRDVMHEVRIIIARSAVSLGAFAAASAGAGEASIDRERARTQDIVMWQKAMEAKMASFIIRLEGVSAEALAALESTRNFSTYEWLAGVFSGKAKRRLYDRRVRRMSFAADVRGVLAASDVLIGMLTEQRDFLELYFRSSEARLVRLIGRRKQELIGIESIHKHVGVLSAMLRDCEFRLAEADRGTRNRLAAERSALAEGHRRGTAQEEQQRAESLTLGHCIAIFEAFTDTLISQIAGQNTLVDKLAIDTEQCVLLYHVTAGSSEMPENSAQLAVADTISAVRSNGRSRIAGLLDLSEKTMLSAQDIQKRKTLSDEAFSRRFPALSGGMRPPSNAASASAGRLMPSGSATDAQEPARPMGDMAKKSANTLYRRTPANI